MDQCIGLEIRKCLGWFLPGPNADAVPDSAGAFGHPGAGGSVGYADPAHGLAVGFCKTRLVSSADPAATAAVKVTAAILDALELR